MIMSLPLFEAAVIAAAISSLPGSFALPPCNSVKRDPNITDLFNIDVPNALDPGFKYTPDGNNALKYTVEVGQADHDPGFTCGDSSPVRATTKIYGYGQGSIYTWPGKTFEVKKNNPITVTWKNNIQPNEYIITGADNDGYGNFSLDSVVDTSLHWAYSLKDLKGSAGVSAACSPSVPCNISDLGVPIVTHLHGGHSDAIHDGNPGYFFNYDLSVLGPEFVTNVYNYPNNFDPTAIWYHDHALGITRLNVYAGMAGFYFVRDPASDSGKPNNILNLPIFPYELAYAIQDRMFKNNGEFLFPAFPGDPGYADFIDGTNWNGGGPTALPEFFGDHMVVNGKVWPKAVVEPRKYRLRLLNGCGSRFLVLQFVNVGPVEQAPVDPSDASDAQLPFYVIGTDQGLKTRDSPPVSNQTQVVMAPGERLDIIIDFAQVQQGNRVILKNIGGDGAFGGVIPGDIVSFTDRIMAFDVTNVLNPSVPNKFSIDYFNSKLAAWGHAKVQGLTKRTRRVALFEGKDEYGRIQPLLGTAEPATDYRGIAITWPKELPYIVNGLVGQVNGSVAWHTEPATENPSKNDVEEWEIWNVTPDAHPIHLHLVHFEVLSRHNITWDGVPMATCLGDGTGKPNATKGICVWPQPLVEHSGEIGQGYRIVFPKSGCPAPDVTCYNSTEEFPEGGYVDIGYPKDIVIALPNQVTKIKAKFHKTGRYVWHCHILSHEDHEMMRVLNVGPQLTSGRNLRN